MHKLGSVLLMLFDYMSQTSQKYLAQVPKQTNLLGCQAINF